MAIQGTGCHPVSRLASHSDPAEDNFFADFPLNLKQTKIVKLLRKNMDLGSATCRHDVDHVYS